jgi:cation diffusion facilitator CzcD-associated flavoprotein CzcO
MKYDVIVIGCGMSGILAGIHLKNSGKKFIILEKAGTLGEPGGIILIQA